MGALNLERADLSMSAIRLFRGRGAARRGAEACAAPISRQPPPPVAVAGRTAPAFNLNAEGITQAPGVPNDRSPLDREARSSVQSIVTAAHSCFNATATMDSGRARLRLKLAQPAVSVNDGEGSS